MNASVKFGTLVVVAAAGVAVAIGMGRARSETSACCCGSATEAPEPAGSAKAQFDAIKALVGTWNSSDQNKDGKPAFTSSFRLTGGGSAVMETMFVGQPHEMVNMYTLDGDTLVLTHYCAVGNQPHLKAAAGDAKVLSFSFVSAGNLPDRTKTHMHTLRMTIGDGTIEEAWDGTGPDGKSMPKTVKLTRAK